MSKRVYEIARELELESKEVISRLREAGIEVKSHSSSVEDPVYERVFGANGSPQNGRSEAQEAEAREARAEAERSGHGASVAAAPAEEPVSVPPRKERKRRRVVIDASATNRAPRQTVAPAAPKETERAPVEEKPQEAGGGVR